MAPPTATSAQERVPPPSYTGAGIYYLHTGCIYTTLHIYTALIYTQHCIGSTLAIKTHIILDGICTSEKHGSMVVYVRSMAEYV